MADKIDYAIATSGQIELALCQQIETIRLAQNRTQAQLASEAGVSLGTIVRLERGAGVSLDTFIRVLTALGLQRNLQFLLPDPTVRPLERVEYRGKERRRARPKISENKEAHWSWGDEEEKH